MHNLAQVIFRNLSAIDEVILVLSASSFDNQLIADNLTKMEELIGRW